MSEMSVMQCCCSVVAVLLQCCCSVVAVCCSVSVRMGEMSVVQC